MGGQSLINSFNLEGSSKRKKTNQTRINLWSQRADNTPSNTSVENNITKDLEGVITVDRKDII